MPRKLIPTKYRIIPPKTTPKNPHRDKPPRRRNRLKPKAGVEDITIVQMASVAAAMANPVHPWCTSRLMLPRCAAIMNLIDRRVEDITPGAWRILAFQMAMVLTELIIARGTAPRVGPWLLEIAARNLRASDTHSGIDWVIPDRSKKAWQQRDRAARRLLKGLEQPPRRQRREKKAA